MNIETKKIIEKYGFKPPKNFNEGWEWINKWISLQHYPSNYNEIPKKINSLLEEYSLTEYSELFEYLAWYYMQNYDFCEDDYEDYIINEYYFDQELLLFFDELEFVLDKEIENATIEIKYNIGDLQLSSQIRFDNIFWNELYKFFRNYNANDIMYYKGYPNEEDKSFEDFFLKHRDEIIKRKINKKGRKPKNHFISFVIDKVQQILQNETALKTDSKKYTGGNQALFIYEFLDHCKFIVDEDKDIFGALPEEKINYVKDKLRNYRKNKSVN